MRRLRQTVVRDYALTDFREKLFSLLKTQSSLSTWKYIAGSISAFFLFLINRLIEPNKDSLIGFELTNINSLNTTWIIILVVLSLAYLTCLAIVLHYLKLQRKIFISERRI